MKHVVRVFLFNVFALWITSQFFPTLVIPHGWQVTLFAGLMLSILMLIVAPLLRILFIPINILTFGLLSWFINVIVIFLLTIFVPEIRIMPWTFPGSTWSGFSIPAVHLSYFLALILTSLSITTIADFLHYVSED
ncbi:MAG TPA: phage holin family protein [Patescibacteria group bacterium]|nr:phage holin family protein [Patescibacteria group bacterium]